MNATTARINIYLDDPGLHTEVCLAASRQGVTLSAYCTEAIRRRFSTGFASDSGPSACR